MPPCVDVVIPVHRAERSIGAAIASASSQVQGIDTSVIVVLHDLHLEAGQMEALSRQASIVRCDDGIPSPSGPRNVGLQAGTAPWVFFLDSDDELAPLCLRRLYEVAEQTHADVVLPSIRGDAGYVGTPLVWRRKPRLLDVVTDGLLLRSHSFALLRRSKLASLGARYPAGIRSGQDLVFMAKLYTSASTSLAFDAVYLLHDHAGHRVTTQPLGGSDQVAAVRHLLESGWVRALPPDQRASLAHRMLSVNLAGGWRRRRRLGHRTDSVVHAEVRDLALALAPECIRLLSVRDRVTLRFDPEPSALERLLMRSPGALLPTSASGVFHPRGPLAHAFRSWLVRCRRRVVSPDFR